MELVPGSDFHLDKKSFDWILENYDETSLKFLVKFDHPEYMSIYGSIDTLKIKFSHNRTWMMPNHANYDSLPDGYILVVKIPP